MKKLIGEQTTGTEGIELIPTPGERFRWCGITFVILGIEQGGALAIAEAPVCEKAFDEEGRNDWRSSTLRAYLNGAFLERINKGDLLPFISDLTSDDGLKDYGTAEDYVFLLSCDLYRKYRQYIPKQRRWWWTLTPWTASPDLANHVRYVSTSGALDHYFASYSYGVVPSLLFKSDIFKMTGERCDSSAAEDQGGAET